MAANKNGWTKVGTVCKRRDGEGTYLKVDNDVTLTKGTFVNIQNPRRRKGATEEDIAKIPDWVVAELHLPPQDKE